jgi:hypothetical protein
MPFFQPEPFDSAQATYIWTGSGAPGFFSVHVKGHAQKFTSGIELVRDTAFVGGLAIDVMGWTGPLTKGTDPYTVSANFKGSYSKEIVVKGANKTEVVHVREIPFTTEEAYLEAAQTLGKP